MRQQQSKLLLIRVNFQLLKLLGNFFKHFLIANLEIRNFIELLFHRLKLVELILQPLALFCDSLGLFRKLRFFVWGVLHKKCIPICVLPKDS